MMRDELIRHMKDCSTEESFCFEFMCSSCGTRWHSRPIPFSRAGEKVSDKNKKTVYDALYRREWNFARNAVLDEAIDYFSICPICHGLICDCCFLICDEIEMCCVCAEKLHESGEPVMARAAGG